ncbi:hypothetical protein KLP28_01845 [Nocardioidaceae bacterium]|nr:hypothetical protein KLP28_01845 [Nocardioidaceae bacterium]
MATPARGRPATLPEDRRPTAPARLRDYALMPLRVGRAVGDVTLALGALAAPEGPIRRPGGYADRTMLVIGRGGLLEQLTQVVTDANGPMRLANTIADVLAPGRPVGEFIAEGGLLDNFLDEDSTLMRLIKPGGTIEQLFAEGGALDRLLQPGGAFDRLMAPDGPLERLLEEDGALDRITARDGLLDRLLEPGGFVERLLEEDGFAEKLTAEGGTLDQLVALGEKIEAVQPQLDAITEMIPDLHHSVDVLSRSVGPLGDLANRLPGSRRRPQAVGD